MIKHNFVIPQENVEIDIDDVVKIEKDECGREYIAYKNKGETESGYTRDYSYLDLYIVKAIKQLNKKIGE